MTTSSMKRAAAAALAAVLSMAALTTARADITDYEFRLVQTDVKQGNG
ncbi:MAG: heavy metal RND transporter, partial [Azorhizobium sp. 39-67-5]